MVTPDNRPDAGHLDVSYREIDRWERERAGDNVTRRQELGSSA